MKIPNRSTSLVDQCSQQTIYYRGNDRKHLVHHANGQNYQIRFEESRFNDARAETKINCPKCRSFSFSLALSNSAAGGRQTKSRKTVGAAKKIYVNFNNS